MQQLILTVQHSPVPHQYVAAEVNLDRSYFLVPERGRKCRLCLPHVLHKYDAH